ncbi:microsomal glutathione S-transferase 1 isoform X1 [Musca domestica]|uniref:Microsomal glutathione S-transferase 1 n=1 Tax=Musca domestica TaxID=7370 RepID=A0ABM3VHV3_MUSDO|nr:microsomal glutathione S-transferase 1 isoform X1 [Musca domestica]
MAQNATTDLLSLDNEVFTAYLYWSGILVLKILAMAILTGLQRFRTGTFANPEDCMSKKDKVTYDNPYVERVRRAHLNDLENILPFFAAGFFYILTNPSAFIAINLFRAVAAARILHTIVYAVVVIPQPARALSFFVAFLATGYMALQVVLYAL